MNITLNGKPHSLNGEGNVVALLASLKVKPEQVAVAINGDVVPRRDWPKTNVNAGDVIEVVRAVGGGAA
ncbi:MAG: sulfur carrier protein ThiS [Chloroflexota bacterium]